MEIKQLPKSLNDITLQQWVDWNNASGMQMLERSKGLTTEDEMMLFESDFCLAHYAHYSNTPIAEVEAEAYTVGGSVVEIIKEASLSQAMLFREMCDIQNIDLFNVTFAFDNRTWKIVPPLHIQEGSKLTVAEFERTQDIALILSDLQDNKFEAMYELCQAYLKPADNESELYDVKLLPLHIALCVKRYAAETMNLFNTLINDRATTTP